MITKFLKSHQIEIKKPLTLTQGHSEELSLRLMSDVILGLNAPPLVHLVL